MFDLRAAFPWGSGENQIAEGGVNAQHNCLPASFALIMMALGYPDIEPQAWVDAEYRPGYVGDTDFDHAIAFMNTRFSNPPTVDKASPPDTLGYVDSAGQQGFPCAVLFHSDTHGYIGGSGSYHVSIPIRFDGLNVLILNVASGSSVSLNQPGFSSATAGSLVRFNRAVTTFTGETMTPSQKEAFVRLAYIAALGREPESVQTQLNWANQIHDNGDNTDVIMAEIADSPEGALWRQRLHSLVGS